MFSDFVILTVGPLNCFQDRVSTQKEGGLLQKREPLPAKVNLIRIVKVIRSDFYAQNGRFQSQTYS